MTLHSASEGRSQPAAALSSEPSTNAVSNRSWGHHRPHVHPCYRVGPGQQEALRLRRSAHRRGRGDAAARQLRRLRLPRLPPVRRGAGHRRGAAGQVHGQRRRGPSARSRASSASTSAPRRSGWRGWPAPAAPTSPATTPATTGSQTCRAAALVAGGGKGCFWGCLGLGDCDVACDFDAIHMNAHELPGRRRGAVHRLRRLRRGLPQGPVLAAPGEPPALGRLQLARGRRRDARGLRGRLHRLRPLRDGRARA